MSQSHEQQLIESLRAVCGGGTLLGDAIAQVIREELAPVVELAASPRREYMDEKAASLYCGMPATTLRKRRSLGKGPSYIKDGGKVLYARRDLDRYMEARRIKTYEQS
uniref:helix-turn-helix domain-containing protein n=1 Tax=uncultured Bilophila sp. TaxID=529385 RepID=UPI0025F3855D|nr:helix-turn-helix domain-containing protein [uncultured Bilophila sp.]